MNLRVAGGLVVVAAFAIAFCRAASATDNAAPVIELHTSREAITLELAGASRREVLTRLFNSERVRVEWRDEGLAEEALTGHYEGSLETVVDEVLDRTNFVMVYGHDDGKISRIIVIGRASGNTPAFARTQPLESREKARGKAMGHDRVNAEKRLKRVREQMFERMRATGEAIRKRTTMLPPGHRPMRTQAITTVPPSASLLQHGNIPYVPRPSGWGIRLQKAE